MVTGALLEPGIGKYCNAIHRIANSSRKPTVEASVLSKIFRPRFLHRGRTRNSSINYCEANELNIPQILSQFRLKGNSSNSLEDKTLDDTSD